MKRIIKQAIATVATLIPLAVFGPAPVHASPGPYSGPKGDHDYDAYWVDLQSIGLLASEKDTSKMADNICWLLQHQKSEGDVIAVMLKSEGSDSPTAIQQATIAVHAAEWHFCPEYW